MGRSLRPLVELLLGWRCRAELEAPPFHLFRFYRQIRSWKQLPGLARQFQGVRDVENSPGDFQKLVAAALGKTGAGMLVLEQNPFFGLKAIDENRSYLFFERERETEELLRILHDQQLLMLTGDSGLALHSRLVPCWRRRAFEDGDGPGTVIAGDAGLRRRKPLPICHTNQHQNAVQVHQTERFRTVSTQRRSTAQRLTRPGLINVA